MVEEEKEEKEEKEWETRYKKIIGDRHKKIKKQRKAGGIPKRIIAGKLSGGTQQKNVVGRRVNCLMCGIKLHVRSMHDVGYGGYYCEGCAKHRGLI